MEKASYDQEAESRTVRLAKFLSNLQISFIAGVAIYVICAFVFFREGTDDCKTFAIVIQVVFWVLLGLVILSSVVMQMLANTHQNVVKLTQDLHVDKLLDRMNADRLNTRMEKLLKQYETVNEVFGNQHDVLVTVNKALDKVYSGQNSLLEMLTSISNREEGVSATSPECKEVVPLNLEESLAAIKRQMDALDKNIKDSSDFQVHVYDGDVRYRLLQMYHVSRYKNTLKEDTSYLESFIKTMLRFQLIKQGKFSQLQIFNRIHYPLAKLDMSSQLKERLEERSMYHISDLLLYDERFGDRLDDLEGFEIQIINRCLNGMISWFRIGAIPEIIMKANINII